MPRLSFPVVVRRGRYAFDYLYIWKQWSKIINAQYTKKNACLISPFPFTIWSIHSIDEIKRYVDRTLHKNCSKPSRHSVALSILHYRDRSGRVANSMFSGDARPSSASDDLPGGSKRRGWIPVEDCPILRILQVLLHPNNRTKRWRYHLKNYSQPYSRFEIICCSTPVTSRHVTGKIEALMAEVRVSGKFNSLDLDFWAK